MKKFNYFLLLILVATTIQLQAQENEEANTATSEISKPKTEEVVKKEKTTPTVSKEEVQKIVKKMISDYEQKQAKKEQLAKAKLEKQKAEKKSKKAQVYLEAKKQKSVERKGFVKNDFSHNQLSFVFGDDNIRDNSWYSPSAKIAGDSLYDDFTDRFEGYSNREKAKTKLTLFHKSKGLIDGLDTSVGIAFGLQNSFSREKFVSTSLYEAGSFIKVDYSKGIDVSLTMFPYNADSMAVGFFPGLRWGDRTVFPENINNREPVPGVQLLLGYGPFSIYGGLKTHYQSKTDPLAGEMTEKEIVYGGFFGTSYNQASLFTDNDALKIAFEGAYINKGENAKIPESELKDPSDDTMLSLGLDLFAQYNTGSFIGEPLGITSYQNGEWTTPSYKGFFATRFRAEGIYLNERLQNADYLAVGNKSNETITENFPAMGGAVEMAVRVEHFRVFALFTYRSLSMLVFDAPGVTPYETIPKDAKTTDELGFAVNADYNWKMIWFGITAGLKKPASYQAPGSDQVLVIKDRVSNFAGTTDFNRNREMLPPGASVLNMATYKFHIKTKLSDILSANAEIGYTQDHNRSKMELNKYGTLTTVWDDDKVQDIISFFVSFEGRF